MHFIDIYLHFIDVILIIYLIINYLTIIKQFIKYYRLQLNFS
jgi:hypothetical protein